MKKCIKCGVAKPLNNFHKGNNYKDGHRSDCKDCSSKYHQLLYLKNKNRLQKYFKQRRYLHRKHFIFFIRRMFSHMQSRVRGHGKKNAPYGYYTNLPICDRNEFYRFAFRNWQLKYLYHSWVLSGYKLSLTPTPDRIVEDNGYVLDNIQFLSFSDNSKKAHR